MSGGGNRVMKGRMGSNYVSEEVDPKEIEKLQQQTSEKMASLKKVCNLF